MQTRFFSLLILLFSCFTLHASVESHFNKIKSSPTELYAFLKAMPTGGELHYHLAGSAYAEHMLKIAELHHLCLNQASKEITPINNDCKDQLLSQLDNHPKLYKNIIRSWSMHDFKPTDETNAAHFFNTFSKFMPIVNQYSPALLAEVITRAANQNERYLEIMILPDNAASLQFGALLKHPEDYRQSRHILLTNPDFQDNIAKAIARTRADLKKAREQLHCASSKRRACQLTVTFQVYMLREQDAPNFFAQALASFEMAFQAPEIVGINLVQPEHGKLSLKNYQEQMHIIHYLHQRYPTVHIALHAGELIPSIAGPKDISNHIHNAVFIGQAERIGHGVDIAYEKNAEALANYMAKHHIAVEVNLTSNDVILDVKGANHPLHFYLRHHVPVVLSTDDEGILRTDLTHEYMKAVTEQHLDYQTIKQLNRNTLTYSFMPGASLWKNADTAEPVSECVNFDSKACQAFVSRNPKAALQLSLEKALVEFEAGYH